MDMLNNFLRWYFSPYTRMKRGMFNIILLLAFLPLLILQVVSTAQAVKHTVDETEERVDDISTLISDFQSLASAKHKADNNGTMDDLVHQRELAQNIQQNVLSYVPGGALDEGLFAPTDSNGKPKKSPFMEQLLNALGYLFLMPVVLMRLRDMGKETKWELYSWAIVTYPGFVVEVIKLFGFTPDKFYTTFAAGITFIMLIWLGTAKSERRVPVSERVVFDVSAHQSSAPPQSRLDE